MLCTVWIPASEPICEISPQIYVPSSASRAWKACCGDLSTSFVWTIASIKKRDAVFILGEGVTHERLIKAIAEQMGLAHEDNTITPVLAALNAILIANVQTFFYILRARTQSL